MNSGWIGWFFTLDTKLRQLLNELSRSLLAAISDSDDVHLQLRRIRAEGYSLSLLLDCQRESREEEKHRPLPLGEPSFRIDGRDLAFLRSLGIDPTRRCRRRRKQPSADAAGRTPEAGA